MMLWAAHLLAVLLLWIAPAATCGRSVLALSNWAREMGIEMHPSMKWKDNGGDDWGLQLTSKVDRGTVLMTVPRSLVLDSAVIKDELVSNDSYNEGTISKYIQALGPFSVHEENFWIVLKLYQCQQRQDPKYAPWLAALPRRFPHFSEEDIECLPYYAKYIARYQQQKLEKFCEVAEAICGAFDGAQREQFKWAFDAVGSRFWKTESAVEDYQPRSELVPLGDMFNHREPPNVKFVHDHDNNAVCFVYLGGEEDCFPQDLFITYGQPNNPHRFLMIFGFVPTDMHEMWSHLLLSDTNPYSSDISKMVFACEDGIVAQSVWDAVLHELDPSKDLVELRASPVARGIATDVLSNHVAKELNELSSLRQRIDKNEGENTGLIRLHNDFLTTVFSKVQSTLAVSKEGK